MRFVLVGLTVAIVAILLVLQATHSTAKSVYLPSELVTETSVARLRLVGRVADSQINYTTEPEIRLQFSITDPPQDGANTSVTIPVSYKGIRPDMSAVGRDVILEGEYRDGQVIAFQLMTQCPSKYEAPNPAEYQREVAAQ